uniref:GPI-anchor transamidase n=1 Tax=Attheya septentrionalis TaxID=420275 RepID=A0A7S2XL40_9STRA|mmetsp:Transcript_16010/g.29110  ORF Transcript_16010/g.29110 Transcript_16010/m.29110 type:complete len:452 (+) Transcript_16010:122-1477(+)|eukprot:CAMPEP_0198285742 /NCGR_PEP_ID=MMETSP1449-20131203/4992_1 /TAXON_ID=420275 /ORGANISM="Attheya septentrionalis, Strain CCMP2084" /LENGTH=451 /DNA_ID=CAMNT_0043983281 /DNA_START=108 /DNA_END=1460 /DNA_ORIENTATION=+
MAVRPWKVFRAGNVHMSRRRSRVVLWWALVVVVGLWHHVRLGAVAAAQTQTQQTTQQQQQQRHQRRTFLESNHTDNHAVIVSSSRYWFNYRHVSNALSIYDTIKRHGIPDENIILMLADDIPCNTRNPFKSHIFSSLPNSRQTHKPHSLYDDNIEIDYRGAEVTAEQFWRVLTGRHLPGDQESRKLHSTADSNVLIYLTGHGGDSFFKFQDLEEITSTDLSYMFRTMHDMGRYKELVFMSDTCQAFTLANEISTLNKNQNVYSVASSLKGENSYAHHSHSPQLGLSIIDRYTHHFNEYIQLHGGGNIHGMGLKEVLVDSMSFHKLGANVGWKDDGCERNMDQVALSDFMAMKEVKTGPPRPHITTKKPRQEDATFEILQSYDFGPGDNNPEETPNSCSVVTNDDPNTFPTKHPQTTHTSEESRKGMSPSDPRFIAATLFLLCTVKVLSSIW